MAQQSTVSEPVVTKGSSQAASPTSGQKRTSTGPENKTEKTPFEFNDLRFPEAVGDVGKLLHWIKFIPTVQQKSSYDVKKATGTRGGEVLSGTDTNRRNFGGKQLGSSADPLNGVNAAVLLGTGLGLYGAATTFIDKATSSSILDKATAGAAAFGSGLVGAGIGAFAGAVIGSIDLTRKTRRAAGSIALYMPDTVQQTVVNDYDQVSMTDALGNAGLFMQAGGSLVNQLKEANLDNIGQTLGSAANSGAGAEIKGVLAEKTGAFGQGITDVLLFSAGYAQNPQVELLFKTIQNREFLFDFRFVPRNPKEAETIIKIIQAFRFFAAPEIPTTGGGRYFIPPSEFDIVFMVGEARNPKLPKLATCVLQGIDVNYGSAGQWAAFEDGMPVEIAMQLRFKEVEIMHKELVRQGF